MLFDALIFKPHPAGMGGTRAVIDYPNGYGASVITGKVFYTDEEHPYELAVMDANGITYTTPLTEDVLGYLTKDDVEALLLQISQLPQAA